MCDVSEDVCVAQEIVVVFLWVVENTVTDMLPLVEAYYPVVMVMLGTCLLRIA